MGMTFGRCACTCTCLIEGCRGLCIHVHEICMHNTWIIHKVFQKELMNNN